MLVLSRKAGERIRIGENITIVVNRVVGSRVSVGIEAPSNVRIVRGELEFFTDDRVALPVHAHVNHHDTHFQSHTAETLH